MTQSKNNEIKSRNQEINNQNYDSHFEIIMR